MSVEAKLMELGIQLPPPPPAVAAYEPWMRTGNLILTSGQLPWKNGELAFSGKCGAEITEDQGYQAARQCAINAISQLKAAAGDLDRVRQIVKVDG
ncbi:MAG: RidA family protein, partial [Verrucomicrobiota bacterium]|nr:RidA family protein [Verrucomicrobiota bacterium]